MTPKKSYEVDVMSDVINRLVEKFQVSKVKIPFSDLCMSYIASTELMTSYPCVYHLMPMGLIPYY